MSSATPATRNSVTFDTAVLTLASGIGTGYLVALLVMCGLHNWMFDRNGYPVLNDFVVFQSAGDLALHGHAIAAYSSNSIHAEEAIHVGHRFVRLYPWQYPPLFFFVAAVLASFPFATAFILWTGTLVPIYAVICGAIARSRIAIFAALGTPWAILATMNGQNGFLTASIIGLALLLLEQRPALAGIVLALLAYKPQFAPLFPFALAFGGCWRAFAWAAIATAGWTALSCAVFGTDCLFAFVHGMGHATADVLVSAGIGWSKLQSLYALLRWFGVPVSIAWASHWSLALLSVVFVSTLWHGKSSFALKAAGLVAAVPLVTPYAFIYDFPLLTLSVAFLSRERALDGTERIIVAIAVSSVAAFAWYGWPGGFVASLALVAAVLRRWNMEMVGTSGTSRAGVEDGAELWPTPATTVRQGAAYGCNPG